MNLDRQLRTDLLDAVEQVPTRHGSLDGVVSAGERRRRTARAGQVAASVLVVVAVGVASIAVLGRSGADRVAAGPDAVTSVDLGGREVAVDGLLPGFEEERVYQGEAGPAPNFPTDPHGPEQPVEPGSPPGVALGAVGAPAVYLGNFAAVPGNALLYADRDGLACIWIERQPGEAGYEWCSNTAYDRAGSLSWLIDPASSDPGDGATVVAAWYGLPPETSIVTATVDASPVAWQRVTGGAAILTVRVGLGSDLVLTALDSEGSMIDFGRDEAGILIVSEQRFDDLRFEGRGE